MQGGLAGRLHFPTIFHDKCDEMKTMRIMSLTQSIQLKMQHLKDAQEEEA